MCTVIGAGFSKPECFDVEKELFWRNSEPPTTRGKCHYAVPNRKALSAWFKINLLAIFVVIFLMALTHKS
jgi:hypothetical protein